MADFRRKGKGYDPSFTHLEIPLNGEADVDLWGGGPNAEPLAVGIEDRSVAVLESGKPMDSLTRRFHIKATGAGTTKLVGECTGMKIELKLEVPDLAPRKTGAGKVKWGNNPENTDASVALYNFDIRGTDVKPEHKAILDSVVAPILTESNGTVSIMGMASTTDTDSLNYRLSRERATNVLTYLRSKAGQHFDVRKFECKGKQMALDLGLPDNSENEEWRAVWIRAWDQPIPPPIIKIPPPQPKKPGRTTNWSVWGVGGIAGGAWAVQGGINFFVLRNDDTSETTWFALPNVGAGMSWDISVFKTLAEKAKLAKAALIAEWFAKHEKAVGRSGLPSAGEVASYSKANVSRAFKISDVDGANAELRNLGAGLVVGYSLTKLTISNKMWDHGMYKTVEILSVDLSGRGWQLGAGGSFTGGPFLKIV